MKELVIKIGETVFDTIVTLDGKPVEMIQHISLKVDVANIAPEVVITFPNLHSHNKQNAEQFEGMTNVTLLFRDPTKDWVASDLLDDPADLAQWDNLNVKKEE